SGLRAGHAGVPGSAQGSADRGDHRLPQGAEVAMSVAVPGAGIEKHEHGSPPGSNYWNAEKGLWSWLTTVDHKRIGIMYLISTLSSLVLGGLETGWTFYVPYSSTTSGAVIAVTFGVFVAGFSSILTGLNFIVTIHKLRAPGVSWYRLPLFLWATYATSVVQIL